MAAPIAPDRQLAAEVRRMALGKIKSLLEMGAAQMSDREIQLHDKILEKLAGTVLPRLNEITGEDGEAVKITLVNYASNTGQIPTETVPSTPDPSV